MVSVVIIAIAMLGFKPPPERGFAMRTHIYEAIATVKLDNIPSYFALMILYLTNRTVEIKIIVKKASIKKR